AVRQGETVTLIAGQSGMQVTSSGIALSDAGIGERVRVRNETSKRVIQGTVVEQGRVEVGN
ncbi:MAG TPA: flagella basal body P-ring formation protein FlgA, partial [Gammaproteobacteria bacterium]|nr:flagella basal body P-ring formation protein FlgA [Gammaproteobacteria bacterium]